MDGHLTDLMTPWCVHAVATLRIAEHLEGGDDEIAALARAAGCDERALHNVLGHLVTKGVFEEPEPGRFALNDAARELFGRPVPAPGRHRRPLRARVGARSPTTSGPAARPTQSASAGRSGTTSPPTRSSPRSSTS